MVVVHHLENSRSQRVLWLLEELGVEYEIKHYKRDPKTMLAPASLLQVHPLGKSPVITDGERTIAESGAIVEYLIHTYGDASMKFEPGTQEWLDNQYWMHYAEGTLMPFMVMKLVFSQIEKAPIIVRPIAKAISKQVMKAFVQPNINRNLAFVNEHLKGKEWFVGNGITGADAQMLFPIEAASARDRLAEKYPEVNAYMQRIHSRPAYKRALERGGPYQLMS
ncbi:MAG: glutathione S-transferase [Pseudomonadales bacterium]|nr:glutathione S-transferase [Pseudomonadales bacterium]